MKIKIKKKDQEPSILGQDQQEPALRARALRAQGFYVHEVHKASNWESKIKNKDQELSKVIAYALVRFHEDSCFFYFPNQHQQRPINSHKHLKSRKSPKISENRDVYIRTSFLTGNMTTS